MELEEQLYSFSQCDSYGERYRIFKYRLRLDGSPMTINIACNPLQSLETRLPRSMNMLFMMPKMLFYETSGHKKAVREETLFRRLPQLITHAPYSGRRCSWSGINDADDHAPAAAILAYSNLPTFLITNIQV